MSLHPPTAHASSVKSTMRLLVVEDSDRLRRSLVEALQREGHAVDETGDGDDALWRASGGAYDLVVLDLMIPGVDGFELLRRLRAKRVGVQVLILSARDGVADRVRGLDGGADDYLVKPFSMEELLARVRLLLRRGAGTSGDPILRVGDLELDMAMRVARRRGRPLRLAPREWALLELLALNQGHVTSRSRIEAAIYDDAAEPMSNVVDAAVYALRRELESDGHPRLLHTRRGMGYVLTAEPDAVRGDAEACGDE